MCSPPVSRAFESRRLHGRVPCTREHATCHAGRTSRRRLAPYDRRLTPFPPSVAVFTARKIRHPTGIFPPDTGGSSAQPSDTGRVCDCRGSAGSRRPVPGIELRSSSRRHRRLFSRLHPALLVFLAFPGTVQAVLVHADGHGRLEADDGADALDVERLHKSPLDSERPRVDARRRVAVLVQPPRERIELIQAHSSPRLPP